MLRTNGSESSRTLLYSVAVTALATVAMLYAAKTNSPIVLASSGGSNVVPQATFNADPASLGGIPDATACGPTPGTPRNVTFTTSGLSGSVTSVDVSMTIGNPNHTWMGDVIATLIAPNGASHTIFGQTGSTTSTGIGDSSDLGGTYVFTDSASSPPSGGWWQESAARLSTEVMTSGTYRTTGLGGAGQTNPAPATNMNADFAGVANANGTWTLRFTDGCTGDTGSVSAAALSITTGAATVPDANVDFNGDGKTDYVVTRATSSPLTQETAPGMVSPMSFDPEVRRRPGQTRLVSGGKDNLLSPPIYWYTAFNGSATTGVGQLGDAATDFLTPEDFDGDGKDDLAVWTEAAATQANFKILQSSTNTVRVEFFGQTGDDPAVVGDYDGDGKADPAVYRCPALGAGNGQCYFFYRGSNNNPSGNVTFVPWGFGQDGDFFPYVGDFDGDGKNDFCVQRADPNSPVNGQFVLLKSSNGGVEFINWGLASDFIVPGDYDGDGKTDFCVRRTTASGARQNWILTRTGATGEVNWGITGDISAPGDYDGDGKTDLAIWRGSPTPGASQFWVLNSSNGSVTQFVWGQCATAQTCDFPAAGWAVH